ACAQEKDAGKVRCPWAQRRRSGKKPWKMGSRRQSGGLLCPSSLLLTRIFNPKGIASTSPGLRGTSYPGCNGEADSTLQGLRRFFGRATGERRNPFRVGTSRDIFPG